MSARHSLKAARSVSSVPGATSLRTTRHPHSRMATSIIRFSARPKSSTSRSGRSQSSVAGTACLIAEGALAVVRQHVGVPRQGAAECLHEANLEGGARVHRYAAEGGQVGDERVAGSHQALVAERDAAGPFQGRQSIEVELRIERESALHARLGGQPCLLGADGACLGQEHLRSGEVDARALAGHQRARKAIRLAARMPPLKRQGDGRGR